MERIVTYGPSDLKRGRCSCCSEVSNEILVDDGRCIDCIQMIEFEEMCDKMWEENGTRYM